MNHHCWGDSRHRVNNDDDAMWPELRPARTEERHEPNATQISRIHVAGNAVATVWQTALNAIEYPKLGESTWRGRQRFIDNNQLEMNVAISESDGDEEVRKVRRHRSTDSIKINLKTILERHRWPHLLRSHHPTKITVDISKLNVNMSIVSPQDSRRLVPKTKGYPPSHISKRKRFSRIRHAIIFTRTMKDWYKTESRQINRMPVDDADLIKKLSALTCFNSNYRNTSEVTIGDDTITLHPDLHEKLETLSLNKMDDSRLDIDEFDETDVGKEEPIDCEIMNAALNLNLCDETGGTIGQIVIKKDPLDEIRFSKKFREYCTNIVTPELKKSLEELLGEISRLQKRLYERDRVKGRSKRRYYAGIKEVQKHIDLRKIKLVVIAPDLEKVEGEGGLDDALSKLIGTCSRYEVPYCFGLSRRKLGYYIHGKGSVSCIGIANYSGAEEKLKNVLFKTVEARNEFTRIAFKEAKAIDIHKLLPRQEDFILSEIIKAYLKILASSGC